MKKIILASASPRRREILETIGIKYEVMVSPYDESLTPKDLTPEQLKEMDSQVILANTYHLYMRPGDEIVKNAGGIHKFMNYHKPILTDSGGFQVFSLAKLNDIKDDGVTFRSNVDGSKHFITPEKAIAIENNLGADIIMAFDECSAYGVDYNRAKRAMVRTHNWLERCYNYHKVEEQALFPIVQGNMFKDLRLESLKRTLPYAKCGIAIGGLSVGEPKDIMYDINYEDINLNDEDELWNMLERYVN